MGEWALLQSAPAFCPATPRAAHAPPPRAHAPHHTAARRAERSTHAETFRDGAPARSSPRAQYDDHGESDKKLDRKEFSDWLWEEVNSFGSAKQDENFLSVTKKLRELAMVSRLFTTMDKDSSGFLEPKEFNSILATYNGQDWSSMSHEEKKADTEGFLKFYDDHGEADKKLDRKEFSEWLWEEVISFGSAREDENFAAVVEKLESLTSSSSS